MYTNKFNFLKTFILIIVSFLQPVCIYSQVAKSVELDSVMIQAVKQGFDVVDFIEMVQADTSFVQGFKNLVNAPYKAKSNVTIYDSNKSDCNTISQWRTAY
ncbi:MAG: hypothetical protein IPP71_12780 [Bacteroidetes bacterium]|nr:hypothetical protein [Bacteroidota bacterium]